MKELFSKLTWADYVALMAVLRGLYVGYKSGFFQELLRVAGYVVSLVLALMFHGVLASILTLNTFLNEPSAKAIAFVASLVGIYVGVKILRVIVTKALKVGEGGAGQKIAGAVVGAARLLLLLSFFFMLVDKTPLKELKTDVHERSLTGPAISQAAPMVFEFLSHVSTNLGFPAKEVAG